MIDISVSKNKLTELAKTLGLANVNQLPKITKVTINAGIGPHKAKQDMVKYIEESLTKVTGQKPVSTFAKKAIAGFKIRENDHIGYKVTLRGQRMDDFLNRLLNITIPRLRDFRGIEPKSFDQQGNLTIGFRDLVPFAEMGHEAIDKPFGLEVVITVKNSSQELGPTYLLNLGFPIKTG